MAMMAVAVRRLTVVALYVFSSITSNASAFLASPQKTGPTASQIHHPSSLTILSASPSDEEQTRKDESLASKARRALLASSAAAVTYNAVTLAPALGLFLPEGYEKVSPLQFIAALPPSTTSPSPTSGEGAENWGLWPVDPGPLGLRLRTYERVKAGEIAAPAWLNDNDFFLDENAIVMPQPQFPLPPGKYLVTGARTVTAGLTIEPSGRWALDSEAKLYDVTHLPCRAARYKPNAGGGSSVAGGGPASVRRADFPVAPGGVMPEVPGTSKQDYAVLFVVGKRA